MAYDSRLDTLKHIEQVQKYLKEIMDEIFIRSIRHDRSKLISPEKEGFDEAVPKLWNLTYGSPEYLKSLGEMEDILRHHYDENSHHPQHYENGVDDMDLLDIIEMFTDWKAATLRHRDGNFLVSVEQNKGRFGLSEQLYKIFVNTAKRLNW